jgi:hypothetical protein
MSRGLDGNSRAELDKKYFSIVNLIQFLDIGPTPVYLTDGPGDITWDGKTFQSMGTLLAISDLTEEEDLKIETVDISLSAIDTDIVKLFLDYDYIDRRVVIHRAVVGSNYQPVGTPALVFDGRLDQPRLVEDWQSKTATLGVSASSHWSDFDASSGRHTNDTEHQVLFPGDTFFINSTETQKDVKWGKD